MTSFFQALHAIGLFTENSSTQILPVQAGDIGDMNALWTNSLALGFIRAVAKAQLIHLCDHTQDALVRFNLTLWQKRKVGYFGGNKQHGRGILAARHTSPATDTGCCIHCKVGIDLTHGNGIGVGGRSRCDIDKSPCGDHFIKSGSINH